MAIIAISSKNNCVDALFEERFGRAACFVLFDTDTADYTILQNIHAQENSGAGIKTSEWLINQNVSKIITGRIGPKAKNVLDQCSIAYSETDLSNKTIDTILKELVGRN